MPKSNQQTSSSGPLPWRVVSTTITNGYTYGHVFTVSWLYDQFNIVIPKTGTADDFKKIAFTFMAQMEKLKNDLLENHFMLLNSIGDGKYQIVEPKKQTDVVWDILKKKLRKILSQADKGLLNVDHTQLNNSQKVINSNKIQSLTSLRLLVKREIKNASTNTPTTNPVSPMPSIGQAINPQQASSQNSP